MAAEEVTRDERPNPNAQRHGRRRRSRLARSLLAIPFLFFVYPPLYARQTPKLGAFPFFLWYQFAAAAAAAVAIGVVYLAREKDPGA